MNVATDPAVTPAATAQEVLTAAERLADHLDAANAALRSKTGERADAGIGAIAQVARSYEISLKRLDPATLTADLRARLRRVGEQLQVAAAENELLLSAKVQAQRRLISCVSEAVAAAGVGIYSRHGTLGTDRPDRLVPPAATLSCAL